MSLTSTMTLASILMWTRWWMRYECLSFTVKILLQTGYTTHSIYCQPLTIRGALIGVLEFINKNNSTRTFTQANCKIIDISLTSQTGGRDSD